MVVIMSLNGCVSLADPRMVPQGTNYDHKPKLRGSSASVTLVYWEGICHRFLQTFRNEVIALRRFALIWGIAGRASANGYPKMKLFQEEISLIWSKRADRTLMQDISVNLGSSSALWSHVLKLINSPCIFPQIRSISSF